jgi:hypothetical protein
VREHEGAADGTDRIPEGRRWSAASMHACK